MQWFGQHGWAVWLALGLVLAAAELLTLDLALLMLAVGAFAGCITAVFLPDQWPTQVLVAVGSAAAMLGLLRPTLLAKIRAKPGYRSQLQSVVGSEALALTVIDSHHGRVRLQGEDWTARAEIDEAIPEGAEVIVARIDGAIVHVYPKLASLE